QVVAPDQQAVGLVEQDRVGRAVPGALVDRERPPAGDELLAVADDGVDLHRLAVAAEAARDVVERLARVVVDPVQAHHRERIGVVALGLALVAAEVRREPRRGRHARARTLGDLRGEPDVVVVLVGEDDELDVLDAQPELAQAVVERRAGLVAPRSGVYEREWIAAQHTPGPMHYGSAPCRPKTASSPVSPPSRRRTCCPTAAGPSASRRSSSPP